MICNPSSSYSRAQPSITSSFKNPFSIPKETLSQHIMKWEILHIKVPYSSLIYPSLESTRSNSKLSCSNQKWECCLLFFSFSFDVWEKGSHTLIFDWSNSFRVRTRWILAANTIEKMEILDFERTRLCFFVKTICPFWVEVCPAQLCGCILQVHILHVILYWLNKVSKLKKNYIYTFYTYMFYVFRRNPQSASGENGQLRGVHQRLRSTGNGSDAGSRAEAHEAACIRKSVQDR